MVDQRRRTVGDRQSLPLDECTSGDDRAAQPNVRLAARTPMRADDDIDPIRRHLDVSPQLGSRAESQHALGCQHRGPEPRLVGERRATDEKYPAAQTNQSTTTDEPVDHPVRRPGTPQLRSTDHAGLGAGRRRPGHETQGDRSRRIPSLPVHTPDFGTWPTRQVADVPKSGADQRVTPERCASGRSRMPNRASTPSRISRASARSSRVVAPPRFVNARVCFVDTATVPGSRVNP